MKFLSLLILTLTLSFTCLAQQSNSTIQIDTIITFDPETGNEDIQIIQRKASESPIEKRVEMEDQETSEQRRKELLAADLPTQIDTMIVFDPKTMKEEWHIIHVIVDPVTKKRVKVKDQLIDIPTKN